MASAQKPRKGDSTLIVPGAAHSATQILRAAQVKGKRAGDSQILRPERLRRSALSITAKFALIVSAAMAVSVLVFGFVLYGQLKKALNAEIDAAGVHAAQVLAAADVSTWLDFRGAYENTDYGGKELALAKGEWNQTDMRNLTQKQAEEG